MIPAKFYRKRTSLFVLRIFLACGIIAGCTLCMVSGSAPLFCLGLIGQGAMYVHLIELQHSVLHRQVFDNDGVARAMGFLLGLPMLISYSDFQYNHLKHHKLLGTEFNTETFSYRHKNLHSAPGFMRGMFDYSRWNSLSERICKSIIGNESDGDIQAEYRTFAIVLMAALIFCSTTADWRLLIVWLAPLLAAEPIHFLLELPEHFGLPAHSKKNVFENTRLWGGSWFANWYTHYTNYHLVHHFSQTVPMDDLPELAKLLSPTIPESSRSESYPAFFLQVIRGEIRNFQQ